MRSDQTLYDVISTLLTGALSAAAIFALVHGLRRSRPGLAIGVPISVAFCIRVLATAAVSLPAVAREVRGSDELGFLDESRQLVEHGITAPASLDVLTSAAQTWTFAFQFRVLGDVPDMTLRMTQVGLAVAGLALLAVAVHDLAGPRPAVLAAWLLALEPAGIFFSSILHKEPPMFLAAGLVAFGGARLWTSGRLTALAPMAVGVVAALATRQYVGVFLAAAAAAIV